MKIKLQTITPATASKMLEGNDHNRPISNPNLESLSKAMTDGQWKLNGDTICFNGNRLIDGQHRLMAVVKSGVTIQAIVVNDLDDDVFDTKDIGKKRSGSDTLGVMGEKNIVIMAGALRVIYLIKQGKMLSGGKGIAITNIKVRELLKEYGGVRDSIAAVNALRTAMRLISPSWTIGLHFLFAEKDPEAATLFMDMLDKGNDLSPQDPIFLLRKRLLDNSMSNSKLPVTHVAALVVKTWNAIREEKTPTFIKWQRSSKKGGKDSQKGEAFPQVK